METIVEIVVTTITRVEAGKSIPWPSQLPISGCLSGTQLHTPLSSLSSWIASTVYSVICFSLITYRFLAVYINGNVTSELAETFIRDGFILFTMVCGSIVLNIILLYVFPDSVMVTMGLSWLIGASSIASSRTILSLREAARHKSGLTSEYELPQLQSGPVMISPANVVRLPRSYGGPSFFSRGNHDAGDTTLNLHQVESWSSNVRST
ncbi:hypothetical protein BC629DRAFT_1508177 [Irpex lacteus]|nr:hypothetical protein BC629DRAFT_1508177 [Irpex lacteus]